MGAKLPQSPAEEAAPALAGLAAAAAAHLRQLTSDAAGEVCRMLKESTAKAPRFIEPRPHGFSGEFGAALEALTQDGFAGLAGAIGLAAPHLRWITYDLYPRAEIGDRFAEGHCFASLAGSHAPFHADDFDFGLFLIGPKVLYRDHSHAAPELYVPLTGPHGWRFEPGGEFGWLPAHAPVWNPPYQPHATLTGDLPFLGFYGWTRDVDEPARVIPADDWDLIESGHKGRPA